MQRLGLRKLLIKKKKKKRSPEIKNYLHFVTPSKQKCSQHSSYPNTCQAN